MSKINTNIAASCNLGRSPLPLAVAVPQPHVCRLRAANRCSNCVCAGAQQQDAGSIVNLLESESACVSTIPESSAASSSGALAQLPSQQEAFLDGASRKLVQLATVALVADAALRAAAQAAAGAALQTTAAWLPLASNLTSYLILSSAFVRDGERETAICYLAGLGCTLGLLAQAFMLEVTPAAVFWPAALLASCSAALNCAKLAGWLEAPAPAAPAWPLWYAVVGCVGWAMVPQIAYLSFGVAPAVAGHASWGPAVVSLVAGAALVALGRAGRLPRSWRHTWDVAAWTATLLFMMEPLPTLAAACQSLDPLLALNPADFALPALATGLQVPRALVRDHMWFTGTSWATCFACLQAALAASAQGELLIAAAALGAPVLGAVWLLHAVAAARGHPSPLDALQPVAAAYRQEWRPLRRMFFQLRRLRWAAQPMWIAAGLRALQTQHSSTAVVDDL